MILLVDAGNSRLKWASLDAEGNLSPSTARPYAAGTAMDALRAVLQQQPVTRMVLVHVLGAGFGQAVQQLCAEYGVALQVVHSQAAAYGIRNGYRVPASLGADRFVAMVAARQQVGTRACIVADCGTAATLDALDAEGRHRGGLILPGLATMLHGLQARTQQPLPADFSSPSPLADHTAQAVGSGCLLGLAAALDGLAVAMARGLGGIGQVALLLTGGDATQLRPWMQQAWQVQPDLLLQGLRHIAGQTPCSVG